MQTTLDEAFDPRANSIGFLRWLMAFAVIFSHAGPLAGFYGGHDLGVQISREQSIGGVAVAGFFFFSGFLITKSRMGCASLIRYFWRRCLRIFPAFWTALIVTAFVLAPIAWMHERGTIDGYWNAPNESPLTYFTSNMWLSLDQRNIAEMGGTLPYASHGGYDWNGSAWTLIYEFRAYIIVGVLGLFGVFTHRKVGVGIAAAFIAVNCLQWLGLTNPGETVFPWFADGFNAMFMAPFAFGMIFALYPERIPMDDRLAALAGIVAIATYALGGWNVWGQFGFLYFLMWFAVRATKLNGWEKHGDFSYGLYIFAWPIMTFAAFFGLHHTGWFVYHLVIVLAAHVAAFFSWHLIEKPAMSLKNWTPRAVTALSAKRQQTGEDPADQGRDARA